jgi:hypothetical protein
MAASKRAYESTKRKNVSGVTTTKSNKQRKTTKFNKAVKAEATKMLASVVASTKAENDNKLLQEQVNQLQISSAAAAASGKAEAASVTFADDQGQLLMNKLNSIVGRVHGKGR